ncbi:MAG: ankyrin repeat domain-containing protein [Ferruginibacter sp.]
MPVKQAVAQQRSAYDLAAWIIAAVPYYDTASVNWALKEGGQIDFKRAGMNALEMAIYYKKTEMIRFLLDKGASVDSVNQDGMNALQFAEKSNRPEIIELIRSKMKHGAAVSTAPAKDQNIPGKINKAPKPVTDLPVSTGYKAGDQVLHSRDRGKTWEPGTIKEVSTNTRLIADGISPYLVENAAKTSQNYLDLNFITTFTRQPSWTGFFTGDWNLHSPIAATERIIDRDVYQIISGGDRLPPIRINANGTYSWVIDKKKVIKGRWTENKDAPGIILLKGYRAVNWLVYNTSDSNNRKIFKTDYIIIADQNGNYLSNHGFRIVRK